MHRPIPPPRLAELVRAIERINDPHALGIQATLRVVALFAEDYVAWSCLEQPGDDQIMSSGISRVHHLPRAGAGAEHFIAQPNEKRPGLSSDRHRERMIVERGE